MSLFELLFFLIIYGLLFLLGRFLSSHWGAASWLVFFVPFGLGIGLLAYWMIRSVFLQVRYSLQERPACQMGKCKSRQYVFVELRATSALFRCQCGDLYLASSSGESFSRVLPDNSKQPYMIRNSAGNWEPAADR